MKQFFSIFYYHPTKIFIKEKFKMHNLIKCFIAELKVPMLPINSNRSEQSIDNLASGVEEKKAKKKNRIFVTLFSIFSK